MTTETIGLFYMLSDAGPVVKSVMLLLLFFSITSWAIIFIKFRYIRKAFKESNDFTDMFWQSQNLSDAFSKAKGLRSSPAARIFIAAYMEMARSENKDKKNIQRKRTENSYFQIIGSIKRSLNRSIGVEIRRLVQLVPFLATAGNPPAINNAEGSLNNIGTKSFIITKKKEKARPINNAHKPGITIFKLFLNKDALLWKFLKYAIFRRL